VSDIGVTRCAPPHLTARRISSYSVLGFTGYAVANLAGAALASRWELSLGERLIAFFAAALAFLAVVTISKRLVGHERIVFYQTTMAGIACVVVLGLVTGARLARLLDLVVLGIGTFLVFGRLGCHAVACCHGTLGRGVVYGPAHVAIGFWSRWSGRALWPVQLVEAAASSALVLAGLAGSAEPGRAALIYALGYAAVRFALELIRGDGARPYAGGLSEAQWMAVATTMVCAAWRPGPITIGVAIMLTGAAERGDRGRRDASVERLDQGLFLGEGLHVPAQGGGAGDRSGAGADEEPIQFREYVVNDDLIADPHNALELVVDGADELGGTLHDGIHVGRAVESAGADRRSIDMRVILRKSRE